MKNLILSLASVLTTVLIFAYPALATSEGGATASGENPYDESVPGAQGQGVVVPGIACSTCEAHASRVGRFKHTVPGKTGNGTNPANGAPTNSQSTQE